MSQKDLEQLGSDTLDVKIVVRFYRLLAKDHQEPLRVDKGLSKFKVNAPSSCGCVVEYGLKVFQNSWIAE